MARFIFLYSCVPELHIEYIRVFVEGVVVFEPGFAALDLDLDDVVFDQHADIAFAEHHVIELQALDP